VSHVGDDLGSYKLGRAAESERAIGDELLGEAKVANLDVAFLVNEYILRFQVPVYNLSVVQVSKRRDDTARVEARGRLVKTPLLAKQCEELAT